MNTHTRLSLVGVLCVMLVFAQACAQFVNQERFGGAPPPEVDSAKAADISHLLDLTGGKQMASNMLRQLEPLLKGSIENSMPEGEQSAQIVEVFMQKWRARGAEGLIEMFVPIYDRYFSHEEIRELIQFYETPIGRRILEVMPKIQQEGTAAGEDLGRKRVAEIFREMEEEFPELKE